MELLEAIVTMITVVIVLVIAPIWFSLKAKPIGFFSYHWGTYLGIGCAACGLLALRLGFTEFSGGTALIALAILGNSILSGIASIGLLKRRRWGVIAFFLTCLSTHFMLWLSTRNLPIELEHERNPVPGAIALLVLLTTSSLYFKKRWTFFGQFRPASSHTPAQYSRKPER